MENNYANYDLFDQVIAHEKRARKWTSFLILLLLLLSGAIIYGAIYILKDKKIIALQQHTIQKQNDFLQTQNSSIDSITNEYRTTITKLGDSIVDEIVQARWNRENDLTSANRLIYQMKDSVTALISCIKKESGRLFIEYNQTYNAKLDSAINK